MIMKKAMKEKNNDKNETHHTTQSQQEKTKIPGWIKTSHLKDSQRFKEGHQ